MRLKSIRALYLRRGNANHIAGDRLSRDRESYQNYEQQYPAHVESIRRSIFSIEACLVSG